jgi:4-hydroxyproline epimerase
MVTSTQGFDRVRVVDTHTGGEPTRIVVSGGPDLGRGSAAEKRAVFRERFDAFRSAVVCEPRGSEVMVGAMLVEPADPSCVSGVIYFNDVGFLGMCGHGTIGVTIALGHLGRITPGTHRLETPVGVVSITLEDPHHAAIDNVASYRTLRQVEVEVPGLGPIVGDVAWGGNWFFLVENHGERLALENVERLTAVTRRIRQTLIDQGITGDNGGEIDHIVLFGPAVNPSANSRSFVLCPGKAYDRSPCGTGTSAKLACLVAEGKLREGETWRQESIVGSLFEGSVQIREGRIYPRIRGSAYVNAEATLIFDPADPFVMGIRG